MIMWIQASTSGLIANKIATLELAATYVKNLMSAVASSVASIAKQTVAWGASTAAKVADKVALLATTAAVTAHTVATTVATGATTAFSAALAFLAANPIVLIIAAIVALIAGIVLLIKHWDDVKAAALSVWDSITSVWGKASEWFSAHVLSPIQNAFKSGINFLIDLAEGFVNGFIKGINSIINAINMIKVDVPKWVRDLTGMSSFGFNLPNVKSVSIPRLATGAVIPPNAEFMAILGDQTRGRNIEAPEGLIEEIVNRSVSNALEDFGGETTIRFEGSMGQLIRVMKPHIDKENNRRGKSLIKGAPAW
jgi:hypothetical protein